MAGGKALDLLERLDFDLIVTDLAMPVVDGFQVMTAAKKLKPDTQIIILTGQGTLDNAVKAIQYGAYDFVTKPVEDLTVFLISINRALEKRNHAPWPSGSTFPKSNGRTAYSGKTWRRPAAFNSA